MNEKLIDAVGRIDDELIAEADALRRKKKQRRPAWVKWGTAAACLCLIAAGTFALLHRPQGNTVQQWKQGYAAEYFKFCDTGDAGAAESESKAEAAFLPWAENRSFAGQRSTLEAEGVIPVIDTHPLFYLDVRYLADGGVYCAELTWSRRGEGRKEYSDLKVVAGPEEVQLIDDCDCIAMDEHGNVLEPAVTVTERDGVQIVARGGESMAKSLTWQTEQGWYQVSGSWNDDYAPVAALLDWFWEHPLDFTRFPMEEGDEYTTAPLNEVPEAFRGVLPDFEAFDFLEESTVLVLKNGVPVTFEGHYVAHADAQQVAEQTYYDVPGYTQMHWCVFAEPDVYDLEGCLGDIGTLTQEQVTHVLTQEDNKVKFMQDGLLIIVYPDDADEAWALIDSLRGS